MTTREDANRLTRDAVRPQRVCDHCGGPFGMVTHRWWGSKFCKRRCKDAYLREIMLDRDTVHRWFGLLGEISRTRSIPARDGKPCCARVVFGRDPNQSMSRPTEVMSMTKHEYVRPKPPSRLHQPVYD